MVSNSTATMAADADPFLAMAESEELKRLRYPPVAPSVARLAEMKNAMSSPPAAPALGSYSWGPPTKFRSSPKIRAQVEGPLEFSNS